MERDRKTGSLKTIEDGFTEAEATLSRDSRRPENLTGRGVALVVLEEPNAE